MPPSAWAGESTIAILKLRHVSEQKDCDAADRGVFEPLLEPDLACEITPYHWVHPDEER